MSPHKLILLGILFLICFPSYGVATGEQKQILVLFSYDTREQWSSTVLEGISSALAGVDVQLHVECLDARRHQGDRYLIDFMQFITSKYSGNRLDLVIVVDNAAFDLMLRIRQGFRSDIPLIFCGINNFEPSMISGQREITGVNEAVDIPGTVNLALGLFPKASRLVVLGGTSGIGAINLENFRKSIPAFDRKVDIEELIDTPRESLAAILDALPKNSIILRMDNLREQDGTNTPLQQSISLLSAAAPCPVFSFWDFDLGHGAVGGIVVSGLTQGKKAGELALLALQGHPLGASPIVIESPNIPMFDYAQMYRFGIENVKLPHNALVINEPTSFYSRNKGAIWSGAIVLALIVICIVLLLIILFARLRAEKALHESDERCRLYVDNAPAGIFIVDDNGRYLDVNPEACRLTGFERDELLSMTITDLLTPDSMPLGLAHFSRISAEGHAVGELSYRRKDGEIRWWSISATRISNDRFLGFANDVTDRRRSEEALKLNQVRLTLAMDLANMVSWEMDISTNTFTFDDRFYALYGTSAEREGGHLMPAEIYAAQFVHPEDAWLVTDEIRKILKADELDYAAQLEHRILLRNGEIRYIVVCYRLIRDEEGRPVKTIGANQDITDRKRIEQALRESEIRFKALHNASFGGIAIHDNDVILDCNQGLSEMSGYSQEELVGMDSLLLIAEKSRGVVKRNIFEGYEKPYEAFGVRKNKEEYPLRLEARNIPYQGRMVRAVEFRDITDQKRSEKALLQAKLEFEGIFENSQVGIMLLKGDRVVARGNKRLAELLGYGSPDKMAGISMRELHLDEEHYIEFGECYYKPLSQGDQTHVEYQLKKKDGTPFWAIISGKALDPTDLSKGVIWVMDDLTQRKALEIQLTSAKESAEAANSAKSEFLANMSHEIRTPLNGIIGMLQLIQDTQLNEEQNQFIGLAVESSRRLTRLLSDILDLARVEAGKLQMQVESFKLYALVKQLAALHEPVSLQTGVQFQVTLHPGLPSIVLGDSVRLQQVLTNLIGNAFKFTTAGSITLEVSPLPSRRFGETHVLFAVSDTGCGMDESILEKLFEPFVQASQGYTRRYQGAGLGLSIVKRIVELMGGAISVESELGMGTTFNIVLPFKLVTQDGVVVEDKSTTTGNALSQLGFRILVAEDDIVSSMATAKLLEKNGCWIHVAHDGEEVLDALREMDFDLILMDVQMPVMDGVEATKRIRTGEVGWAKADIPIIAMTAYTMMGDRERFLSVGMTDYIAKPVEWKSLYEAIDKCIKEIPNANSGSAI